MKIVEVEPRADEVRRRRDVDDPRKLFRASGFSDLRKEQTEKKISVTLVTGQLQLLNKVTHYICEILHNAGIQPITSVT